MSAMWQRIVDGPPATRHGMFGRCALGRCAISRCAILVATITLSACATRTPAPVVDRMPPPAAIGPAQTVPNAPMPDPLLPSVAGAVPPPPTPGQPDWRPELYTVKRGDTLFQIALEHGLDYRELASLNNIENIHVIRVGQVLRVRPPTPVDATVNASAGTGAQTAPLVTTPPVTEARPVAATRVDRPNSDSYKTQPKAIRLPFSDQALAQLQAQSGAGSATGGSAVVTVPGSPVTTSSFAPGQAPGSPAGASPIGPLASAAPSAGGVPSTPAAPPVTAPAGDVADDQIDWAWPVRGRILSSYSESASLKGIDIAGSKGLSVVATAAGRVVYAGSGLRGYGKLVIVKHNKTFLSAYAHLDAITIREGQNVTKGQQVGTMGSSDADQVKLHFEIRALGKPVDPMRYLPKG